MSYLPAIRRGALRGLVAGAALALGLLALGGFGMGEPMEAASFYADVLAAPVGLCFLLLGYGGYASQWMPYIAIAVPLNWTLLGAVVGAIVEWAQRKRSPRPAV